MSESTGGFRGLLGIPQLYDALQSALGAGRFRAIVARDYVQAGVGDRLLDVGCGTGQMARFFPQADYLGVDLSERYVAFARARFGAWGRFVCGKAQKLPPEVAGSFDIVLAVALLHHLGEEEAMSFVRSAHGLLRPGGRFITVDPCYASGQSPVARFIIDRDRGLMVRDPGGYEQVAHAAFSHVQSEVRHDLARIPYTHCVLVCHRTEP